MPFIIDPNTNYFTLLDMDTNVFVITHPKSDTYYKQEGTGVAFYIIDGDTCLLKTDHPEVDRVFDYTELWDDDFQPFASYDALDLYLRQLISTY